MNNKLYFTPGPSELYPTVPGHVQTALTEKIGVISHRSKQFQDIFKNTTDGLRQLLSLPDNFHIFFLGSATEVWERMIQNCVEKNTFHCVNGSFSKRFYEFSGELQKNAVKAEVPFGEGFFAKNLTIPQETELICLTHNETSSGASMPVEEINKVSALNKDALICVDAVSSLPYPAFDYSKIDSAFFSVQKCFGLPAGLGVWILNDRCVEKAEALVNRGIATGTYHSISSLLSKAKSNQTPETPNVFNIFLLGKVLEDMNKKGIQAIRKETEEKADAIYDFIEQSEVFSNGVKEPLHRSKTTIVANTNIPSPNINEHLAPAGMAVGTGYGSYKEKQIRIANFPTHTPEQVEKLLKKLGEIKN
ncbi:aminotransferase class V-fold PLP-dependent enzyme [Cytophagaceae bacterium ABcell3]|nr:aminotransferase class V-fold PLP-dependent enzyme [Cytophagaceae bacterium ABcell3]